MTLPTLTVSIGRSGWILGSATKSILGTTTYLGYATFDDITSKVRQVSIRRGRQHELDRVEAGTATVVLMNQDGVFDPMNTSSPYYPDIRPMVPLRIQATWILDPTHFSGLVAWYDFSDITTLFQDTARTNPITADTQVIKGVTDKSGIGNHLSEATNGPAYRTGIINGHSVARFDGTNDTLTRTALVSSLTQPYTVFFTGVYRNVTATSNLPMMDGDASGRSHAVTANAASLGKFGSFYGLSAEAGSVDDDTSTHVFVSVANGASSALHIDGGADTMSANPGTDTIDSLTLANNVPAGGGTFAQIDFLHLVLYSGNVATADKNSIGQYLADAAGATWTTIT